MIKAQLSTIFVKEARLFDAAAHRHSSNLNLMTLNLHLLFLRLPAISSSFSGSFVFSFFVLTNLCKCSFECHPFKKDEQIQSCLLCRPKQLKQKTVYLLRTCGYILLFLLNIQLTLLALLPYNLKQMVDQLIRYSFRYL